MGRDYYEILGIPRSASPDDIRNAYLKLAREWHPDLKKTEQAKQEAKVKFQDIAEAFEVLNHPTRKKVYDRGGEDALTGGGKSTTTGPLQPGQIPGIPPNSANRLAAQFFGYGIQGLDPVTGRPLGGNNVPTRRGIPGFNMTSHNNGTTVTHPNGSQTTTFTRSAMKPTQNPVKPKKVKKRPVLLPCECTYEDLFTGCEKIVKWNAYEEGEHVAKEVTLDIQPGWAVGHKIDFEDEHDEVSVIVIEKEHSTFKRKKEDLFYKCDITLYQAMCCGEIVIPTIVKDKNLKLKFNGTIESGHVHEIKGHGMPYPDSDKRGKLIVTFTVKLPSLLTKDQRQRIGAILQE